MSSPTSLLSSVDSALAAPAAPAAASQSKKIHDAAQQFEALMIGEMLKSAREAASSDGWLGSGQSTGDDSAMDMAESQFARALASSGGLGLSGMIERTLSKNVPADQNISQTPGATAGVSSQSKP